MEWNGDPCSLDDENCFRYISCNVPIQFLGRHVSALQDVTVLPGHQMNVRQYVRKLAFAVNYQPSATKKRQQLRFDARNDKLGYC
jgi:hypothetical protein